MESADLVRRLTRREGELLALIADGLSNESISSRMFISPKTVEAIVGSILRKLELFESGSLNRRVIAAQMLRTAATASGTSAGRELAVGAGRGGSGIRARHRGAVPISVDRWFGDPEILLAAVRLIGARRMVTLAGPAGVGKTRLAIEVVARVRDGFGGDVVFVDLASVPTRAGVLPAVAMALGQTGDGDPLAIVEDGLEGRRCLLVLDNCEHVGEPVAELATAALARLPLSSMLLTSRHRIGLAGERVLSVVPLTMARAVELYTDRAASTDSELVFSEDDVQAIERICRRLDGLPLAIELAAARNRALAPEEIGQRLDQHLSSTVVRRPGTPAHHQALDATIDWSFHLLTPGEQDAFRRATVFMGSFSLGALEALAADGPAPAPVDALVGLVDKSMIEVVRAPGIARYRLLDTLRRYGLRQLGRATAEMRSWHADYFAATAAADEDRWAASSPSRHASVFELDWENLRAAHGAAIEAHNADTACRLALATAQYAIVHLRREHADWVGQTLELMPEPPTALLGVAARWASRDTDSGHAIALADRGIAAAPGPEHPSTVRCWQALAFAYTDRRQFTDARRAVAAARAAANDSGDAASHYNAFSAATYLALVTADAPDLTQIATEFAAHAETLDSDHVRAYGTWVRARAALAADPAKPGEAMALAEQALQMADTPGTRVRCAATAAEAALRSQDPRAGAMCATALDVAYRERHWLMVDVTLAHAASHLERTRHADLGLDIGTYLRSRANDHIGDAVRTGAAGERGAQRAALIERAITGLLESADRTSHIDH